jgi:hypothetical protein
MGDIILIFERAGGKNVGAIQAGVNFGKRPHLARQAQRSVMSPDFSGLPHLRISPLQSRMSSPILFHLRNAISAAFSLHRKCGAVAQLGECLTGSQEVASSILASSTNKINNLQPI